MSPRFHQILDSRLRENDKLSSVILEKSGIQALDSHFRGNDKRVGILLTISDNGIGIDEAVLPNLFSRYYQVESRSGSAGIGLSIVKWIVEGHGGTIEIKSKKGEGTRVCVLSTINNQNV